MQEPTSVRDALAIDDQLYILQNGSGLNALLSAINLKTNTLLFRELDLPGADNLQRTIMGINGKMYLVQSTNRSFTGRNPDLSIYEFSPAQTQFKKLTERTISNIFIAGPSQTHRGKGFWLDAYWVWEFDPKLLE
jgi:hypothetical protein